MAACLLDDLLINVSFKLEMILPKGTFKQHTDIPSFDIKLLSISLKGGKIITETAPLHSICRLFQLRS